MNAKHVAAAAIFGLATTAGAASATDLHFTSTFGSMDIHFYDGGSLYGQYRHGAGTQRPGRLDGGVSAGGVVGGYWLQPDGDHPCPYARSGAKSWGRFTITNAWGADPDGVWSYCDETPTHSWELRPRSPAQ